MSEISFSFPSCTATKRRNRLFCAVHSPNKISAKMMKVTAWTKRHTILLLSVLQVLCEYDDKKNRVEHLLKTQRHQAERPLGTRQAHKEYSTNTACTLCFIVPFPEFTRAWHG